MVNDQRTFVLGLGHQKCGTTWLYEYLAQSPKFAEGFAKEFHIWDRKDIPLFQANQPKKPRYSLRKSTAHDLHKMSTSPNFYFDYFDKLMGRHKIITADITPSYSGLSAERLADIKRRFLERDILTKAVILVREPLARIKSAVRFNLDRGNYSEGISVSETDFETALAQYYVSEHCIIRTRYQNIIGEAQKVFENNNIYVGFYEQMFQPNEIHRISGFVGIEPDLDFGKVRVNQTKNRVTETKIDKDIRRYYQDVYTYFLEKFPITQDIWS